MQVHGTSVCNRNVASQKIRKLLETYVEAEEKEWHMMKLKLQIKLE